MAVIKLESEREFDELLKEDKPVLVDFYADWCGPCKMMSPIIDSIAEENSNSIKVGKVNVDENQDSAMKYNVMSIPTILIFKNGNISKSFIGVTSKQEIMDALK